MVFFFFFFASLSRHRFSSSTLVFPICGKNPTLMELRLYSLPHSCRKLRTSASFDDWTKNLLSLCLHLRSFRYFKKYFLKNSLVFTLSLGNFLRFFPFLYCSFAHKFTLLMSPAVQRGWYGLRASPCTTLSFIKNYDVLSWWSIVATEILVTEHITKMNVQSWDFVVIRRTNNTGPYEQYNEGWTLSSLAGLQGLISERRTWAVP